MSTKNYIFYRYIDLRNVVNTYSYIILFFHRNIENMIQCLITKKIRFKTIKNCINKEIMYIHKFLI